MKTTAHAPMTIQNTSPPFPASVSLLHGCDDKGHGLGAPVAPRRRSALIHGCSVRRMVLHGGRRTDQRPVTLQAPTEVFRCAEGLRGFRTSRKVRSCLNRANLPGACAV